MNRRTTIATVTVLVCAGIGAAVATGALPSLLRAPQTPPALSLEQVHEPERSAGLGAGDTVTEHPGLLTGDLVAVQVDDEEYLVVDTSEPTPPAVTDRITELIDSAGAAPGEADRFDLVVAAADVVSDVGSTGVVLVVPAGEGWEVWSADRAHPDMGVHVHTSVVFPDRSTAVAHAKADAAKYGWVFPQEERG